MASITKVLTSSDGAIREAEVMTASNHILRRPVNQLVPMEIEANTSIERLEHESGKKRQDSSSQQPRYNLRPRRKPSEQKSHPSIHHVVHNVVVRSGTPQQSECLLFPLN
ncbi:hypothetical protein ANCCAN_11886 [Ancylostoma caninum]|uniref:Uncharacterized protein n=1 Tax=Ancylostoma caninum TaxID=29170 RepID=A0A368GCM2_ANCCA|nr:hypothetical protein ANCCAN_11886 [Ancylostoma caninum]